MRTLLALLIVLPLAACTVERASEPIRVATDATFPPFHYLEAGNLAGYDVELATTALRRAGIEHEWIHVPDYDKMFADLREGRIDMVAATTGITPERRKTYRLSSPYYVTCQAALVREGPDEPRTLEALTGRRVGASGSGTSLRAMRSLDADHVHLQPGESGVDMLRRGDIDALVIDEYEVVDLARSNDDLTVILEPVAREQYVFVLNLDAVSLQRQLDKALTHMERDGTIDALQEKHGLRRPDDWPIDVR